jgi:tetratricopeptide (TPR) repeat protein
MDTIDNRYLLLDKLGEGAMGAVYSAHDRLTGQRVAIKRVRLASFHRAGPTSLAATLGADDTQGVVTPIAATQADDSALLALAHEFRTLASIRHPHVISVLDYGFEPGRRPFFTMELLDGARPLVDAALGETTPERVRLILQVLQALAYVHRRGVLHRDLKPANVLVLGEGHAACAKVVDFGIACVREHAQATELAGTLPYMAPELFAGREPTEASDIWAVAVMAHELLLGAHPLGDREGIDLVRAIVEDHPIFADDARLGPELSAALRRALSRDRRDRYPDAGAFAHALALAAGLDPPAETAEIRESFLQAASFVAREGELSTLRRALDEARAGRGSLWLLGGESGVGKSRLLDELRALALLGGTRVVRGQGVSAGGALYQVWRGALRPLCLEATIGDLDAGVLRGAVPDIAALLERHVPKPPELDPQGAQVRFILTAEALLLSRKAPLLILLEDLQWADPAAVALLDRLSRSIEGHPVLVVGSYRDDERHELPVELPRARRLPLRRLSADEIAALAASMLGEVGKRQDVVALLQRETEGNAFFLVEVVRELAREAGALANVGAGVVPSRVMAGGVQAILARRLARVPDGARPLLEAAAVLGRELDLPVLRALTGDLGPRASADLEACASASVLEVSENRWRFAHDKLREAVLAELAADARASWHRRIAHAIEQAHAAELGPHAAALAYHFDEAGDLGRAARYRLTAGESAMKSGAMIEALAHLERAVQLFDANDGTIVERARSLGLLARAYYGAGRPEQCTRILERLFVNAGVPLPQAKHEMARDIARHVARHARFRLWPEKGPTLDDPERIECLGETLDAGTATCDILPWTRSPAQIVQLSLAYVQLAEELRDPARLAVAYAGVGYGLATSPLPLLADGYLRRAHELLGEAKGAPAARRAFVVMIQGVLHDIRGEWEEAEASLEESIAHHARGGDWQAQMGGLLQGGALGLHRGNAREALDYVARLDDLASRADSAHYLCFARCIRSVLALRAGDLDLAARLLAEAGEHNLRAQSRVAKVLVEGASALCALRRGDEAEARRRADAALESTPARPPLLPSFSDGPPAVVEVYAALVPRARSASERADLRQRLLRSLDALRTAGQVLPIARPSALLWSGRCAEVCGQGPLAAWYLRRALTAAKRWRVPFDEALAHQALAGLAEARGERELAVEHRHAASEMFERLGAEWHLAELRFWYRAGQ